MKIFDSRKADGDGGAPGEVMALHEDGFEVQTGSGRILVKRVQPAGEKKMHWPDYRSSGTIDVGTKLGG